jgi:hypothetical protein
MNLKKNEKCCISTQRSKNDLNWISFSFLSEIKWFIKIAINANIIHLDVYFYLFLQNKVNSSVIKTDYKCYATTGIYITIYDALTENVKLILGLRWK